MKKLLTMMVAMVLVLAGCSSSTATGETVEINMALMKAIEQVPYVYALETGMYEEAGLDVSLTFFNAAKDRNAGWETGEFQVETADLADVAMSASQGQDVVATGSIAGDFKLVASPELSKKYDGDIASLDGMKVGYSENTVTEYYVDYVAAQNNIEFEKVPFPAIPDRFAALQSGDLDLAILPDPFPSMAIADGSKLVWNSLGSDAPCLSSLTWNGTFYNENTDAVNSFIDVTNAAADELNSMDPSEYKDMVLEYDLIEADYYDELTADMEYTKLVAPTEEAWDLVNTWAQDKGIVTEPKSYDDVVKA